MNIPKHRLLENYPTVELDGIVEIPQCGLYTKSQEAFGNLVQLLTSRGYDVEPGMNAGDDPHYFYAKLRDDVLIHTAKCRDCGGYVSFEVARGDIKVDCPHCGKLLYQRWKKGGTLEFTFMSSDRSLMCQVLVMKVYGYDNETKEILLYRKPLLGTNHFMHPSLELSEEILEKHKGEYRVLNPKPGLELIAIRNSDDGMLHDGEPINIYGGHHEKYNYRSVKVCNGQEYDDWQTPPMPESYSIYQAWHWAPREPSPTLHEEIMSAAAQVSRIDFYHQDGRNAFGDLEIFRMRLFVEHFTTLDLARWDELMEDIPLDGPGFIKTLAYFISDNPAIRNDPNPLAAIVNITEALNGNPLTAEGRQTIDITMADEKSREEVTDFLGNFLRAPKRNRRV